MRPAERSRPQRHPRSLLFRGQSTGCCRTEEPTRPGCPASRCRCCARADSESTVWRDWLRSCSRRPATPSKIDSPAVPRSHSRGHVVPVMVSDQGGRPQIGLFCRWIGLTCSARGAELFEVGEELPARHTQEVIDIDLTPVTSGASLGDDRDGGQQSEHTAGPVSWRHPTPVPITQSNLPA